MNALEKLIDMMDEDLKTDDLPKPSEKILELLPLVKSDSHYLHKVCEERDVETSIYHGKQLLLWLIVNNKKVMEDEEGRLGFGLAAPQLGIDCRVFSFADGRIFVNPEIIKTYGPDMPPRCFKKPILQDGEGCLSWDKQVVVDRYERIQVKYIDVNGQEVVEKIRGLDAVAFQHELDHLNGVNIVDYIPTGQNEEADVDDR